MKELYKTLLWGSILLVTLFGVTSCEDYLEKEEEALVSEEVAFKNFKNFQGFIEEIYNCIPDKQKSYWTTSWNWGEDEIMNPAADWHMVNQKRTARDKRKGHQPRDGDCKDKPCRLR